MENSPHVMRLQETKALGLGVNENQCLGKLTSDKQYEFPSAAH